ncbi:NAD(P)-dependent oxidoreductase [Ichthyenterobacterium sp. W332]|uniref:NAD(P)-dependent oxidoreductase n=1 Tax=Microcosmobacter mediterraneus TaxID=3075607 RepID=A0ABU2YJR9_9FLAO|nr:NAD(P)-dependent oxidoreductase [Ichthyenterobacterium sp. W332]MDT0558060.1 NAD(P)-dependent oxidoreductase [Ichthyenterobacterium sp. W332]
MKVLLTSTSFYDTPGAHHELLKQQGYDIDVLRGPIPEAELLPIIQNYDAVICGDDEYTKKVIKKGAKGKLKYISKYGVGLDKIDLQAANEIGIPVTNCPGVNQTSVAEHVLALLFTFEKNVHLQHIETSKGNWKRMTGNEIQGKTIGIIGLGAIGKELSKKSHALGMKVLAFDVYKDSTFLKKNNFIDFVENIDDIYENSDIISLHIPHTSSSEKMINNSVVFKKLKKTPIIINTSRGMLIDPQAIIDGLKSNKIRGYLADVLITEPMESDNILKGVDNVIITPHVGSRTYQSVERQGSMAVNNLINLLKN